MLMGRFNIRSYLLHVIRLSDVFDHVKIYQPVIFSTGDRDVPRSAMFLYYNVNGVTLNIYV